MFVVYWVGELPVCDRRRSLVGCCNPLTDSVQIGNFKYLYWHVLITLMDVHVMAARSACMGFIYRIIDPIDYFYNLK